MLTVSDGVVHGARDDPSGRALVEHLSPNGFDVVDHRVTADGADAVADDADRDGDGFAGLIVSTGGTGFAPRDQTPEGTRAVHRARGARSRRGDAAVQPARSAVAWGRRHPWPDDHLQHPGSTKGCVEQLDAVIDVLPHALRLLADTDTSH